MAILPIIRMGHPTLRRIADPVTPPTTPEIRRLAVDMIETMVAAPGVGLAAPQIGVAARLLVYRIPEARIGDSENTVPMEPRVLVNPVLTPLDEAMVGGREGCLSIPGMQGVVPRYRHMRVQAHDLDGNEIDEEVFDFHARVLQHEVDHLDGVLYLDRMDDLLSFGFSEELMVAEGVDDDEEEG